jgi:hypothetical protein
VSRPSPATRKGPERTSRSRSIRALPISLRTLYLHGDALGLEIVENDPAGEERYEIDLPAALLYRDLGGGAPQSETGRFDLAGKGRARSQSPERADLPGQTAQPELGGGRFEARPIGGQERRAVTTAQGQPRGLRTEHQPAPGYFAGDVEPWSTGS